MIKRDQQRGARAGRAGSCMVVRDARPRGRGSCMLCGKRPQHNMHEQLHRRHSTYSAGATCLAIAVSCTQNMLRDRAVIHASVQHKMAV